MRVIVPTLTANFQPITNSVLARHDMSTMDMGKLPGLQMIPELRLRAKGTADCVAHGACLIHISVCKLMLRSFSSDCGRNMTSAAHCPSAKITHVRRGCCKDHRNPTPSRLFCKISDNLRSEGIFDM